MNLNRFHYLNLLKVSLYEPAWEPRLGWVSEWCGLPEPGRPVAGGVRGVGGEVAPKVGTSQTPRTSTQVNWRTSDGLSGQGGVGRCPVHQLSDGVGVMASGVERDVVIVVQGSDGDCPLRRPGIVTPLA